MRQLLPYDMFDLEQSAEEARRFGKMENIYHRGQELAWKGNVVLDELWAKHGGSRLAPEQIAPAQRVLGAIMWGELAAWKVAAQLAKSVARRARKGTRLTWPAVAGAATPPLASQAGSAPVG